MGRAAIRGDVVAALLVTLLFTFVVSQYVSVQQTQQTIEDVAEVRQLALNVYEDIQDFARGAEIGETTSVIIEENEQIDIRDQSYSYIDPDTGELVIIDSQVFIQGSSCIGENEIVKLTEGIAICCGQCAADVRVAFPEEFFCSTGSDEWIDCDDVEPGRLDRVAVQCSDFEQTIDIVDGNDVVLRQARVDAQWGTHLIYDADVTLEAGVYYIQSSCAGQKRITIRSEQRPASLGGGGGGGGGGSSSSTPSIPPNAAPTAVITATPTNGTTPLTVIFDARSSTDADGSIVSKMWTLAVNQTNTSDVLNYTYTEPNNYTVSLLVTDNDGATNIAYTTIEVFADNYPPILAPVGNKQINTTDTLNFTLDITEPDGDNVSCNAAPLPTGAQFNQTTCTFLWTPSLTQTGNYEVTFTVTEDTNESLSVNETITISVGAVNRPPEIQDIPDITIDENDNVNFALNFSDPDSGDTLSCAVAAALPTGAAFDTNSCTFTWNTDYEDAGIYTVTFNVSDDGVPKESDVESVQITVYNVNRPPSLDNIPDQQVLTDTELSFNVTGSDPDGDDISCSATVPTGATFVDCVFAWTPVSGQEGNHYINITLIDDGFPNLIDQQEVLITVLIGRVPSPPIAGATVDEDTVQTGTTVSFDASPSTDDGTIVSYEWDYLGDGNYVLTNVTSAYTYTTTGTYSATLRVTDDIGLTDTFSIAIVVTESSSTSYIQDFDDTVDALDIAYAEGVQFDGFSTYTASGSLQRGIQQESNLISLFKMDDDLNDQTTIDSSSGFNGVCETGECPTVDTTDKIVGTSSYYFDGVDDHFALPFVQELRGMDQLTTAVWIKPARTGVTQHILNNWFEAYGLYISSTNRLCINIKTTAGSPPGSTFCFDDLRPDQTWQHVAVTYDGQYFRGYLNGQKSTDEHTWNGALSTSDSFAYVIGQRSNQYNDRQFQGHLDDLGILDRALSDLEIYELYNKGAGNIRGVIQSNTISSGPLAYLFADWIGNDVTLFVNSTNGNWCQVTDNSLVDQTCIAPGAQDFSYRIYFSESTGSIDRLTFNWDITVTQCTDFIDNDASGLTDYPADAGCESLDDNDESTPLSLQCSNGVQDGTELGIDCGGDCSACGPAPVASLTADPNFLEAGNTVNFDASSSTDDGAITSYEYDYLGDGNFVSSSQTTSYTYTVSGTFNPQVRVTDNQGFTDTTFVSVQVIPSTTCNNGEQDGDETGVDCGGSCGICGAPACSNGIDDDGDGLVDWQYDLGCYGPDDDNEQASDRSQENGWTTYDLHPGAKIVYVSSSQGDDANDGLAPGRAVQTLERAHNLVTNRAGDWMLLKRGDSWFDENLRGGKVGLNGDYPLVVASYGDGTQRPIIDSFDGNVYNTGGVYGNLSFHDLDLRVSGYNGLFGATGFFFALDSGKNIVIENNVIDGFKDNIVMRAEVDGQVTFENFAVRRNIIVNSYSVNQGHSQGIFLDGVRNALIEENIFDSNGYNREVDGAKETIFNHNIYSSAVNEPMIIRDNLVSRASSHGLQLRPGGLVDGNIFINNSLAMFISGEGGNTTNNVVLHAKDIGLPGDDHFGPRGQGMTFNNKLPYARFENNIVAHKGTDVGTMSAFDILSWKGPGRNQQEPVPADRYDSIMRNNIVYNWNGRAISMPTDFEPEQYEDHHIVVENNLLQYPDRTGPLFAADSGVPFGVTANTYGSFTASGNTYHSAQVDAGTSTQFWFYVDDAPNDYMTSAQWQTAFEPDATFSQVSFIDPDRNVATYMQSIGRSGELDEFIELAKENTRWDWQQQKTPAALRQHIQDGFVVN